jgi:hypothetical protein
MTPVTKRKAYALDGAATGTEVYKYQELLFGASFSQLNTQPSYALHCNNWTRT